MQCMPLKYQTQLRGKKLLQNKLKQSKLKEKCFVTKMKVNFLCTINIKIKRASYSNLSELMNE